MRKIKYLAMFLSLIFLVFSGAALLRAEDDENEYERSDDKREQEANREPQTSQSSSTQDKSESQTVAETITTPPRIVTKTVITEKVLDDSDRDGFPDIQDPHPSIAEMFIVKDDNRDGIDDNYQLIN